MIAPVFVCAGIGFTWRKLGHPFDTRMVGALALNLGMPCLVFSSLTRLNVSLTAFAEMVGAYAVVMLCFHMQRAQRLPYWVNQLDAAFVLTTYMNSGNVMCPCDLMHTPHKHMSMKP